MMESRYDYLRSSYYQFSRRLLGLFLSPLFVVGCTPAIGEEDGRSCRSASLQASNTVSDLSLPQSTRGNPLLIPTWITYKERFIQADGRVIDREARDRTVSEGQAYAMLRAVMINDRATFERTLSWAETNLARPEDTLWAWHWGEADNGQWQVLDPAFATDADIDAVTALILAARRWNCPAYMDLAKTKLDDIWTLSTVSLAANQRHLLPGPAEAFWKGDEVVLNPSYFAPYAFRLFAQVDRRNDWLSLVDTGYDLLEQSTAISTVGLPSDWIQLNLQTGRYGRVTVIDALDSRYSFDAFRVWWRVALDAAWFNAPQAESFLSSNLQYLKQLWRRDGKIAGRLDLEGQPLVEWDTTAQYAMLYPALRFTSPLIAREIYQQKLLPSYTQGFWDNNTAYYTQNLSWFGLLPLSPPTTLLE